MLAVLLHFFYIDIDHANIVFCCLNIIINCPQFLFHHFTRSDYQIFKKIVELDYEYPDNGFDVHGRDLVEKLLVCILSLQLAPHSFISISIVFI